MAQYSRERRILHIDMDAFYASVEQHERPELRGKPVVVGGDPTKRGVVATCSYEARKYGLRSAMPSRTAYRLCPQAIFVAPRFDLYRAVSKKIMSVFLEYTDLIEPLSLDEAFLDITINKKVLRSPVQVAQQIRDRILEETGLTASAGVSYNRVLAKLASDFQKPNGMTIVTPRDTRAFLDPLPIRKFFGVGKVAEAKLKATGVETGKDLLGLSEQRLCDLFGKQGSVLYHVARGEDDRAVNPNRERKSLGRETTFEHDIEDWELVQPLLIPLAEQVIQRLAAIGCSGAQSLTVKIKWADFTETTKTISLSSPITDVEGILHYLPLLLAQVKSEKAIRLLGVTLSQLQFIDEKNAPSTILTPSLWDAAS